MRLLLLTLIVALAPLLPAEDFSEADKLFTLKVGPLLSEKCNGCHGDNAEKIKGGLDMLTREKLLAGGEEFGSEVLVPGDVEKSFLVETIKWSDPDWEMPPKENDRLTEEQIKDVEAWIEAGAPWPEESVQLTIREAEAKKEVTEEGVIVKTSGGLGDDWTFRRYQPEDIWAFQKVKKPEVPKVAAAGSSERPDPNGHNPDGHHPVDAFILAKLNKAGHEPAPQADPLTLLRRATLDLTGLPPTPKETAAFRSAWSVDSDKAWAALIDR
ncbi:MAG: DUF1549 domain-containing protein, partial [Verrucomicrobiales bacterium]|nr:DUF1549 domain-containing protein [Verrucomicrobiales bacterium]